MAVLAVILVLSLSATLIYVGSVELNRRAERWERWMHPPDDWDGMREDKDNGDSGE